MDTNPFRPIPPVVPVSQPGEQSSVGEATAGSTAAVPPFLMHPTISEDLAYNSQNLDSMS